MNVTLRELIYGFAGGIRGGRQLKAIIPGGSSTPVILPDQLDAQASFDGLVKAGSMLGSAAIIVMDDTTCMVWLAENLLHFYKHESCGKCTPCREGTDWLLKILHRIETGEGAMKDIDLLLNVAENIGGKTLCPFGDAAVAPVLSTIQHFRHEYEAHVREGRCTCPAEWRVMAARGLRRSRLWCVSTAGSEPYAAASGQSREPSACTVRSDAFAIVIVQLGLVLVVFTLLMLSSAAMVYAERKVAALIQQREGPNRVGPAGLLQPFADVIKLMFKEELRPGGADAILFVLAPIISATAAFAAFAVVPFGAPTTFFGLLPEPVKLQVADVNVAVLVVFAITSMSVYGIVLAGWSSNSKYSLLGALALGVADDQLRAVVWPGARGGPGHGQFALADARSWTPSAAPGICSGFPSCPGGSSSRRSSASWST